MIVLRNKFYSSHKVSGFVISDKDIWKKNEKSDMKKLSNKQLKALGGYEKTRNSDKDALKGALIGGTVGTTALGLPLAGIGGLAAGQKGAKAGMAAGAIAAGAPLVYMVGKEHLSRKRVARRARKELEKRNKKKNENS